MRRTVSTSASTAPRTEALSLDDARWAAFIARDAGLDGEFFIAVKTTGIYCRPSCAARRPKRENVRFFATAAEAERAGFRPCKRCKPNEPSFVQQHSERVKEACRLIETAEAEPKLDDLAEAAGLSPYHFHRVFKSVLGVTPKAYAAAHRNKRVREELGRSATVTEAIYGAGFNSNGRFYATSSEALGMTPNQFRAGGADAEIKFAIGESSLGLVLIAASDKGVCAIFFGDDAEGLAGDLKRQFPRARLVGDDRAFAQLTAKVIGFVENPRRDLDLPLDIRGTAFQRRVWEALRRIPVGRTATYAEIAKAIGAPKSVRAVGRACGSNPISLAIPCHRVVGSNGSLTGYRGGIERKRALLAKEAKS
jgi:AraC family transcriptional regulator, regulatory protein of adaptative response / methylated-DNA-[protein]-cysteine methyltransferase